VRREDASQVRALPLAGRVGGGSLNELRAAAAAAAAADDDDDDDDDEDDCSTVGQAGHSLLS